MLPACENIFAWAFVFLRKLYCYFWGCLVIFLICFWVHESPTVFKSSLHFYCDNLHILCTFFFFTYIGILYFYNSLYLLYSSLSMNSLYLSKFAYGNTKQSCYLPPPQPIQSLFLKKSLKHSSWWNAFMNFWMWPFDHWLFVYFLTVIFFFSKILAKCKLEQEFQPPV